MKTLYYDCFAGIAGDMNIAALIDLGVPLKYLRAELDKLNLKEFKVSVSQESRKGISGKHFKVIEDKHEQGPPDNHHDHKHDDHSHHHDHSQPHSHSHHHHRSFGDIKKIINSSKLSDKTKDLSLRIFNEVAIAEAKIHRKSIDEVHFHEVGAIDSIVDIVGAAICYDYLKIDKVLCSTVELGGGQVKCAHGILPVPAPATAEILKDVPVKSGLCQKEMTTPTGAALVKAMTDEFVSGLSQNYCRIGYGLGSRELEVANCLRVFLIEENAPVFREMLEAEFITDDMNQEDYPFLMKKLYDAGANEVSFSNVYLKKGRIGTLSRILFTQEIFKEIEKTIYTHSSTFGFRFYHVKRSELERQFSTRRIESEEITVKEGFYLNNKIREKPEYENLEKTAESSSCSISDLRKKI